MKLKIASWVQLIVWNIFLLTLIDPFNFFQASSNSDLPGPGAFIDAVLVCLSAAGVWTSILGVLAVIRIDHPSHDDEFNKLLKFAAVMLHVSFYAVFIMFPLAIIMFLLWALSMIICTGLLITSKVNEIKAKIEQKKNL